jgi:hypothetical protein
VLANRAALDAFKLAASKLQHWHVLAAVLMPDHLHVLVAPTNERYEFNEIEHEHEHDYEKEPASEALVLQSLKNQVFQSASGALVLQVILKAPRDRPGLLAGNVFQPTRSCPGPGAGVLASNGKANCSE